MKRRKKGERKMSVKGAKRRDKRSGKEQKREWGNKED